MNRKIAVLGRARRNKNDEYYTRLEDIEAELQHYPDEFRGKIVYCNCDDPEKSNFWRYFKENFSRFGLKKLISTYYQKDSLVCRTDYDGETVSRAPLRGDGDFRCPECVSILDEADIVVTNPPFSLLREYIPLMVEHKKKFLIVVPWTCPTYSKIFPYIRDGFCQTGFTRCRKFTIADGSIAQVNAQWLSSMTEENSTLTIHRKNFRLPLTEHYNPEKYKKYDNFDAIEVKYLKNIPRDYPGLMGVPATYLQDPAPEQFELIGCTNVPSREAPTGIAIKMNSHTKFTRIFIRNRNPER
mgnify:CR=1 FL=1